MKNLAKSLIIILYNFVNRLLGKKKVLDNGVLIFSFPRSGSTWLMNILAASKNSGVLFEPINPYKDKRFQSFTYHHKMYSSTIAGKELKLKKLITSMFKGKLISWWSLSHSSLYSFLKSEYLVIKILRANYIYDWFCKEFPSNKKIILFRHPCSVINSMSKSPGDWHQLEKSSLHKICKLANIKGKQSLIENTNSQDELHLIFWCLEASVLLNLASNNQQRIVYYENMYLKPKETIESIYKYLNFELNDRVYEVHGKITNTANKDNSLAAEDPLKRWQTDFSPEKLNAFQIILDEFKITCYNTTNHLPI